MKYCFISEEIKEKVLEHSQNRMDYEYDRFKLNDEQRKSMIIVGSIGQLLFEEYLQENNCDYEMEFQAGRYDQYDFFVNNKIIDVKTSGFDNSYTYLNLLYTEEQYNTGLRKGYELIVQIFINGYNKNTRLLDLSLSTTGIIVGFIEFSKIAQFKQEREFLGDDYRVPIKFLIPIEELVQRII